MVAKNSWMASSSEWVSPRQILERYVDLAVGDVRQAEGQLYLAIISGEIRARWKGAVLGSEWLKQLRNFKADDASPLPPDIELSAEDAERKWGAKRNS
jgi:hypothetical protein